MTHKKDKKTAPAQSAKAETARAKDEIKSKGFLRGYLLPKIAFFAAGFPKHAFGSIDITHRCNLRCKHCYFYKDSHEGELTDDQWLDFLSKMAGKNFPFRTCTWVGGEPLLRKDLIEKAKKFFKFNIIVTNGTIPLPDWKDVYFHVSLDGTREIHDKMRNKNGLYDIVKKNANRPDLHVTMVYCITTLNKHCIEEVLKEWCNDTQVKGFMFDFYTPTGSGEDSLFIPLEERDRIIDRILNLKKTYGDFIAVPERVYELMRSDQMGKIVSNCPFEKKGFALDPMGKPKSPCMLGPGADCSRCGCIVPYYLALRTERRYIIKEVIGDIKGLLQAG